MKNYSVSINVQYISDEDFDRLRSIMVAETPFDTHGGWRTGVVEIGNLAITCFTEPKDYREVADENSMPANV
jgi:hypothetical protein